MFDYALCGNLIVTDKDGPFMERSGRVAGSAGSNFASAVPGSHPSGSKSLNVSRQTVDTYDDSESLIDFEDEGAMAVVKKEHANSNMPGRALTFREKVKHSIQAFMARPRNVATVQWTNAQVPLTVVGSWTLPDDFFATTMLACKASDFRFFSCSTTFHFQLNAQKMAVGQLIAVIQPMPTLSGAQIHAGTLTALTGYPHGFLDAGTSPSLKLVVPYVSTKSAYDLVNDPSTGFPWATVTLYVMNTLNSAAGSTVADVSLWVSCSDVLLEVPTPSHLDGTGLGVAQSEANEVAKTGSVSGILKTVSSVASDVGKLGLGPVSEIGQAVGWVAGAGASVASAFGFAKPRSDSTIQPMLQQPSRYMMAHNGMDNSVPMCYDSQNSLDINQDIIGSHNDEMDINYPCSKPCFIETVTWAATDTVNKVLASWPVSPGWCGDQGASAVAPTLMAYVASMFSLWRGGIGYKLQFVANAFYGGRIGLAFLSGINTIGATVTPATIEAAPKVICEIRSTRACILEVPWASNVPYANVVIASRVSTGTNFTYAGLRALNASPGLVVLYVQNSLILTGQIPSTIDINIFAYGLPDLEFAIPNFPHYVPVRYQAPALAMSSAPEKDAGKQEEDDFEMLGTAQSNTESTPENLNSVAGENPQGLKLLNIDARPKSFDMGRMVIGERALSLRSLTRTFTLTYPGFTIPSGSALVLDPRWFDYDAHDITVGRESRISRIYAFQRGGRRFKVVPQVPAGVDYPVFNVQSIWLSGGAPDPPTAEVVPYAPAIDEIGFNWFINVAQTPVIEVSTPFYCPLYNDVISNTNATLRPKIVITPAFAANVTVDIYTACGDDASFGYLIGPPNLQLYA